MQDLVHSASAVVAEGLGSAGATGQGGHERQEVARTRHWVEGARKGWN
jgi:hypothetical protein